MSSAVINGKLYAVGGYAKGFGNYDVNERYDPITNSWESLEPLTSPRNGHTSSILNNVMLVIGGENDFQTLAENEAYIPEEDTWYTLEPIPIQRQGLFSASFDDKIYVMGGGISSGASYSSLNHSYQNNTIPEFGVIVTAILVLGMISAIIVTKSRMNLNSNF